MAFLLYSNTKTSFSVFSSCLSLVCAMLSKLWWSMEPYKQIFTISLQVFQAWWCLKQHLIPVLEVGGRGSNVQSLPQLHSELQPWIQETLSQNIKIKRHYIVYQWHSSTLPFWSFVLLIVLGTDIAFYILHTVHLLLLSYCM